jgi:predicted glycoside hydrolase/deacetylase ChbG (UPF0249 family)
MLSRVNSPLLLLCGFMVGTALWAPPARSQAKTVAERLSFPRDAKLLIIHGDDLAVAHSVDRASFAALDRKAISSASILVPCPWLTEVAAYAKEHPDADLGLHLTLTSEWKTYRWGTTAPGDQVPSLLDLEGYLWADAGLAAGHATPEDAEREIRAQVERAIKAGIKPTHLDSHMGSLFQTPALFAVYVKVARDYGLPFLAVRLPNAPPQMLSILREQDIVLDSLVSINESIPVGKWMEYYVDVLRGVKPGLTELIVHLGYDDAELEAITVDHPGWGAAWRQRDFDEVTSPEFKKLLEENRITVIGWKDLHKLIQ